MDLTKFSDHAKILALTKYSGLNPRLFDRLFTMIGSLDAILSADTALIVELTGLEETPAREITQAVDQLEAAMITLARLEERQIRVVSMFDPAYPILLNELNDPPPLLFFRGELPSSSKKSVVLSGTSNADFEGMEMTTRLAREFSEAGVQIISGFSSGIAASAHLAAHGADGRSFAVVDCGFDEVADSELMPLAIDLANHGGVISEHLPDQPDHLDSFRMSNRLMVGLAQAVVVTELYHDSERTLDLLECCAQIGKLAFIMIDPDQGALADETSLAQAVACGAIPIQGYDSVSEIIRVLV